MCSISFLLLWVLKKISPLDLCLVPPYNFISFIKESLLQNGNISSKFIILTCLQFFISLLIKNLINFNCSCLTSLLYGLGIRVLGSCCVETQTVFIFLTKQWNFPLMFFTTKIKSVEADEDILSADLVKLFSKI